MKRTMIDRLIGFFSPDAELRRLEARARMEVARAFDIAKVFKTSDWTSAKASDANEETKAAIQPGREKARSLVQNMPYGTKAVDVIVTETVGAGIVPKITGRNKTAEKALKALWKEIAETSKCDVEGRNNFYSLQALVMSSMVESGEGLALLSIEGDGPKIQVMESDFIATKLDDGKIVQGVELDSRRRRVKYHLYKSHPGGKNATPETFEVPAEDIAHVYRMKRAGQVRGVTWAHSVVEKMNDFNDYQFATLVRQKVAACFMAFITSNGNDALLTSEQRKAKRESEFSLEPATARYLEQGEDVKLASPPAVEGYADFNRETLRAIAAGWGITYESLTGDYSQSNYSSSRLGHIQMRKNIDSWRWNLIIPHFCDPYFQKFLEYAKLRGIDVKDAKVQWVPPASTMIDPGKEIDADKEAVKAGFKSRAQVIREAGNDPDEVLEEIREEREAAAEAGVSFDTDMTVEQSTGTEGKNATENKAEASDESTSGGGQ
jgi:lambda family phage portal protein